ncbi:MAG: secondary thiamine-phosphate synthase enzyme YjbQ [Candidatus Acetothermia bacterium]
MKRLSVSTSSRVELKDITAEVKEAVDEFDVDSGVCTVYVPHTTAGITINESADPDVARDIEEKLSELVPEGGYRHREGNADSHIKSSLIGNTSRVLIENGQLQLGTWQGIFFAEFDGPRTRKVWVKAC